jgi:hypothetical protein
MKGWMKLFCILALSFAAFAADEPAGRLLSFKGTWNSSRGQARAGQLVYAGEIWRATGSSDMAEFILYSGQTKRCVWSGDCIIPSALPAEKGFWRRLTASRESLPSVAYALARGDTVVDAVLAYSNGQLDLVGALKDLDAAHYRIVLRNLRRSAPPVEIGIEWQPRSPAPVAVAITPGLYELTAVTPEDASLGPAAVLITGPAAFDERSRELKAARSFIDTAQPAVSALARRQFLLTVLDSAP